MENYFHYFSEIEEHFQQRRGTILLLSTLDWALIETWKESGVPLAAVLRGIDEAFDHYDRRPRKTRKINSLAYCAQAVMMAAEEMQEAALGATTARATEPKVDSAEIAGYFSRNAEAISRLTVAEGASREVRRVAGEVADSLREMAEQLQSGGSVHRTEATERRLSVLEEKLFAALVASSYEAEILELRNLAEADMAPYKRKMPGPQIEQLMKQYVHKRLLEKHNLPRLSLFYMR